MMEKPARAAEPVTNTAPQKSSPSNSYQHNLNCNRQSCTGNAHLAKFVELFEKEAKASQKIEPEVVRNWEPPSEADPMLEFTEEESNAALALFGCDCVKSIDALRQMRGISVGVEGNIILPGLQIKPCNQRLPENEDR